MKKKKNSRHLEKAAGWIVGGLHNTPALQYAFVFD